MLKNRNIGVKIGIGIVSMILIISVAMGIVYYKMNNIKKDANTIVDEYLPEVELSQDVLEHSNNIMYNMRGYGLNGNEDFYSLAIDNFNALEKDIKSGEELIANTKHLKKLQEHLDELKSSHEEYLNLSKETKKENEIIEQAKLNSDEAASGLMKHIGEYLDGQESKFKTNINYEAGASALRNRLFKITKMNEVLDYVNEARIINFKAMVNKDSEMAVAGKESLDKALVEIEKIIPLTTQAKDIEDIEIIKEDINSYKLSIEKLISSYDNLRSLASKREKSGEKLILAAEETAEAGINNTKAMNKDNANAISTVISLLLIGLILALIVGAVINIYIVKGIVKGLKSMNKVAQKLSKGDVDVNIEVNSNDEVGQLADAFDKVILSIQNQAEAIEKIADGDLSVEVKARSDKDILNIKLNELKNKFKNVIELTELKADKIVEGGLDQRIDAEEYKNQWKNLVLNINNIADSLEGYIRSVPTTIAVFDKEYNVKYINDFGLKLLNSSLSEVKNKKVHQLFKTDDYQTDSFACQKAMTNGVTANMNTKATILGERYDVEYSVTPIENKNGEIVGAFEIINDQTEIMNNQRLIEKRNLYQEKEVLKLVDNLNELSMGNLMLDPQIAEYDEDTKKVAENFKTINDKLRESTEVIRGYINEISEVLENIGKGNLNQSVDRDYRGDFSQIKVSLNMILDSLNEVMSEISTAADEVATGSNEVAKSAEDLSQGSTEQASAVEQINSSISNIAEKTKTNAENSEEVNEKSNGVIISAENGTDKMNEMIEAMDVINESSKNIGKIIKVIDEIAFQTNILALNAAVEAERAGKYGKGFAVVAEEVRNLAGRSANAAKDTTELIEDSINKISMGTKIAEETGVALDEIVGGIKEVSEIIENIAKASNEQALAIEEVNEGLQQVTDVTQSNTATAEESSAASEEMSSQAEILNDKVSQFRLRQGGNFKRVKNQKNESPEISLDDDFGKY